MGRWTWFSLTVAIKNKVLPLNKSTILQAEPPKKKRKLELKEDEVA